jgi:threonine/homoserine/homoserine lactone efflux protein
MTLVDRWSYDRMISPFIEGLIAGYGIAIPVGAIAILIVSTSMEYGFRSGFMAGAGAASADLVYATVATIAGTALVKALAPVETGIRILSAMALIGLACFGLKRGMSRNGDEVKTTMADGGLRTYGQFLALTLLNPLTIVYFTAYILSRGSVENPRLMDHTLFIIGAGVSSLSWQTLLAGSGAFMRQRFSKRFRVVAVLVGNLIVLALGLQVLFMVVF